MMCSQAADFLAVMTHEEGDHPYITRDVLLSRHQQQGEQQSTLNGLANFFNNPNYCDGFLNDFGDFHLQVVCHNLWRMEARNFEPCSFE